MVRLVPARSDVPEAQAMVDGTAKENIASTLSRGNWRFPWGNHGLEELGLDPAMWSLDVTSKPRPVREREISHCAWYMICESAMCSDSTRSTQWTLTQPLASATQAPPWSCGDPLRQREAHPES